MTSPTYREPEAPVQRDQINEPDSEAMSMAEERPVLDDEQANEVDQAPDGTTYQSANATTEAAGYEEEEPGDPDAETRDPVTEEREDAVTEPVMTDDREDAANEEDPVTDEEAVTEETVPEEAATEVDLAEKPVDAGPTMSDVGETNAMMPGDANLPEVQVGPNADNMRDGWQEIQLGFIDDPRAATEQARAMVTDAIEAHVTSLRENLDGLADWQRHDSPDTEVLRAAMQGYRSLMQSVTGR